MPFAICIKIHGKKHCFPLPVPVPTHHGPDPGPINFPELELATTILTVAPDLKDVAFAKELTAIARRFVDGVKSGLPNGVELDEVKT